MNRKHAHRLFSRASLMLGVAVLLAGCSQMMGDYRVTASEEARVDLTADRDQYHCSNGHVSRVERQVVAVEDVYGPEDDSTYIQYQVPVYLAACDKRVRLNASARHRHDVLHYVDYELLTYLMRIREDTEDPQQAVYFLNSYREAFGHGSRDYVGAWGASHWLNAPVDVFEMHVLSERIPNGWYLGFMGLNSNMVCPSGKSLQSISWYVRDHMNLQEKLMLDDALTAVRVGGTEAEPVYSLQRIYSCAAPGAPVNEVRVGYFDYDRNGRVIWKSSLILRDGQRVLQAWSR